MGSDLWNFLLFHQSFQPIVRLAFEKRLSLDVQDYFISDAVKLMFSWSYISLKIYLPAISSILLMPTVKVFLGYDS